MAPTLRRSVLVAATLAIGALSIVAVTGGDDESSSATPEETGTSQPSGVAVAVKPVEPGAGRTFGPAPDSPTGPWDDETLTTLKIAVDSLAVEALPTAQIEALATSGDPRLAWPLTDILRFVGPSPAGDLLTDAVARLLPGADIDTVNPWTTAVDHLIAWDVPVPDDYRDFKRDLYGRIEPRWAELFEGGEAIDWRLVSWGGVGIDDREFGSDDGCRCIAALDEPPVTTADEGSWYPDDALVFGVVIDGEARAYPKNIMEVHELVNDTLGGRTIALPYCTLCGSAQAYLTDELPDELREQYGRPVLRTSGLLSRSNKMMFERRSRSFVDTFTGEAVSGPLADAGVVFDQVSVVTAPWGAWRQDHPDTTIVAADGGLGRTYELDPLDGRDDDGPIFPIGDVDPRLPVQEPVLGVVTDDGQAIAFHVERAVDVLSGGTGRLEVEGYELRLDGGGLRALRDGEDVGAHQAFWFAWSQFHPDTLLWPVDYP